MITLVIFNVCITKCKTTSKDKQKPTQSNYYRMWNIINDLII